MSNVAIKGGATGTATYTIEAPTGNTDRTLVLPDEAGTVLTSGGAIDVNASAPADSVAIDASGNVGIGTSSPSYPLELHGDGGNVIFTIKDTDGSPTFSNRYIRFQDGSGTEIGKVLRQGSTIAYSTSSDYRLKENIIEVTDATDRLKQLQPKRFNFIGYDNVVDGFLAHEVSDIVPEAISGAKDEVDAEGNPLYQGIDQSKLIPLLTGALQEAIAKIETLEAKVAALEATP